MKQGKDEFILSSKVIDSHMAFHYALLAYKVPHHFNPVNNRIEDMSMSNLTLSLKSALLKCCQSDSKIISREKLTVYRITQILENAIKKDSEIKSKYRSLELVAENEIGALYKTPGMYPRFEYFDKVPQVELQEALTRFKAAAKYCIEDEDRFLFPNKDVAELSDELREYNKRVQEYRDFEDLKIDNGAVSVKYNPLSDTLSFIGTNGEMAYPPRIVDHRLSASANYKASISPYYKDGSPIWYVEQPLSINKKSTTAINDLIKEGHINKALLIAKTLAGVKEASLSQATLNYFTHCSSEVVIAENFEGKNQFVLVRDNQYGNLTLYKKITQNQMLAYLNRNGCPYYASDDFKEFAETQGFDIENKNGIRR